MIEMRFESVFRGVVEAMLPRFSDERLELAVGCRVSFDDYGYERDGNTLAKRGALHISHFLHFLATRPGNYTKVYMYEDVSDQGTEGNPMYGGKFQWNQIADHDSCWDIDSELNKLYCAASQRMQEHGAEHSQWSMHCQWGCLVPYPTYVELKAVERVNPDAQRWSKEGRLYRLSVKPLELHDVEAVRHEYDNFHGRKSVDTRLLLKGSETWARFNPVEPETGRHAAP